MNLRPDHAPPSQAKDLIDTEDNIYVRCNLQQYLSESSQIFHSSFPGFSYFFVNKQWPTPNTLDTHFHAGPKEGYQCLTKVICTPTCAIVYLMVLYMKQWARWGSVLLSAIVSLFSGVSLAQQLTTSISVSFSQFVKCKDQILE